MLICLIAFTILLYSWNLIQVPVHLNQDELGFALNAHSVAKTGFDENGIFLPLYFWHLGVMYATPIIVYLTSILLLIFPISEVTIRFPSILIALSNVILIYFITKKIFRNKNLAFLAGLFLTLTPIHFIQGRILLDNLYPVPFVLFWLYLLLLYIERKKMYLLFWSSLFLGIGVHSYHAAKVMMPLYLIFTLIAINKEFIKRKYLFLPIIVGFTLPLIPLIPWLYRYPDTLTDQVKYTGLYDVNLNPLEGLLTLLTPETILNRISIYVSYFNPKFLFLEGDSSLIHSTGRIGVFLLPFLLLIPVGIFRVIKERRKLWLLIIIGFFSAPLAPALVGNQYRASKELVILPFALLIGIYGLQYLYKLFKNVYVVTVIILLIVFLQFGLFLNDYFTTYRIRSYGWFNYDIPGSLEALIEQDKNKKANKIYLDSSIYFIDRYWRFYLLKTNKLDLLNKTLYYNPESVAEQRVEVNSLFLTRYDHAKGLEKTNTFRRIVNISEPDGAVSFYIYKN